MHRANIHLTIRTLPDCVCCPQLHVSCKIYFCSHLRQSPSMVSYGHRSINASYNLEKAVVDMGGIFTLHESILLDHGESQHCVLQEHLH